MPPESHSDAIVIIQSYVRLGGRREGAAAVLDDKRGESPCEDVPSARDRTRDTIERVRHNERAHRGSDYRRRGPFGVADTADASTGCVAPHHFHLDERSGSPSRQTMGRQDRHFDQRCERRNTHRIVFIHGRSPRIRSLRILARYLGCHPPIPTGIRSAFHRAQHPWRDRRLRPSHHHPLDVESPRVPAR